MEDKLDERGLWVALSYLFVDAKVDYEYIARVAQGYSIEEIEFSLFERVAPVCIGNMLVVIPPIWWYFDKEQLIFDIESLIEKRSRQGWVGKCISVLKGWLIRRLSSEVWAELKTEIEKAKRDG